MKRKRDMTRKGALRLTKQIGLSANDFTLKEKQLSVRAIPAARDIFWSLANDALGLYSRQRKWQDLKVVYWTLARQQFEQGQPHLDFLRQAAKAELQHLRSVDIIKGARIAAGPDACSPCRENNGRTYSVQQAMQTMPIPNPTCQNGWCRCAWMGEIGGHGY